MVLPKHLEEAVARLLSDPLFKEEAVAMWKKALRMILFGALSFAVYTGNSVALAAGDDAQKGRPIYEKYCLLCHGPQGLGDGPQGQLMNPPASNFRSLQSKNKPDVDLLKTIRQGHPDSAMTQWAGTLSEDDMRHVLDYIRTFGGGQDKGL